MTSPSSSDLDPIIAEYDVYLTEDLLGSAHHQKNLYVLQFPNLTRNSPPDDDDFKNDPISSQKIAYHAVNPPPLLMPLGIRLKAQSGFLELDIPLRINNVHYDKKSAIRWGLALRDAELAGLSPFGLASGLPSRTFRPTPSTSGCTHPHLPSDIYSSETGDRSPADRELEVDHLMENFDQALSQHKVLDRTTLSGKIIEPHPSYPIYMLGCFHNNQLHLSKITGVVQMRPALHHIDALHSLDALYYRKLRETPSSHNSLPSNSSHTTSPPNTDRAAPKAIQQVVKSADDEASDIAATKFLLRLSQEEPWQSFCVNTSVSCPNYTHHRDFDLIPDNLRHLQATPSTDPSSSFVTAPRFIPNINEIRHRLICPSS